MYTFCRNIKGQGLAEYSLILGIVALIVVGVLVFFGEQVVNTLKQIASGWPVWTTSK